jgi:SAM-dependent methyltransferase
MQAECIDILTELESWYARENGQYLLQAAFDTAQELLDRSFGYHILQLGVGADRPLCEASPINHRIYSAERPGEGVDLVAYPDELPLDSDSVDTVIIHHSLEFARNPHQVLREVQRVLTPQGQLLVVGFNPYSLLGIGTRIRGLLRHPLWSHHRPVSESRLTDWLHLLGCEVLQTRRLYGVPPAGGGRLRAWLARCDAWITGHNLPVGGLYILHASKQVAGISQSRRPLLSRRGRLVGLVSKPTPAPTPSTPAPQRYKPLKKGDVAD